MWILHNRVTLGPYITNTRARTRHWSSTNHRNPKEPSHDSSRRYYICRLRVHVTPAAVDVGSLACLLLRTSCATADEAKRRVGAAVVTICDVVQIIISGCHIMHDALGGSQPTLPARRCSASATCSRSSLMKSSLGPIPRSCSVFTGSASHIASTTFSEVRSSQSDSSCCSSI
jgi:hypothetical protein